MRSGIACLLFTSFTAQAASTWIRVSTPTIEILTDAGESTARAALTRFETLRRIFRESAIHESPEPLRVFIFSSDREFSKYRPSQSAAAFYTNDDERDFIVLPENTALNRLAAHEYLHMVIRHSTPVLPAWTEEGLAEFYSLVSIAGGKLRIGDPIAPALRDLENQPWLSAEDLALGSSKDGSIFYSESWALVHMLSLGTGWRGALPEFVKRLGQGVDQHTAFQAAFGASMSDAVEALRFYLKSAKAVTSAAPPADDIKAPASTRIELLEITLILADLALHTDHRDVAKSLFERAAQENAQSPAAIAGLGSLALAEDRKDAAKRYFDQAIAAGYRNAGVFFQLAELTHDNQFLEKALAVDPHFVDAHFLLGVRDTDKGDYASAIAHMLQATSIRPRRFTYWHALAYAQAKSGDRRAAAESAHRATVLASNTQEEEMAAALTQLAAGEPIVPQTKKDAVTTPKSWQNPKGDSRAEGTLALVDCEADPVRLVVMPLETGAKPLQLYVANPELVELVNAEGISTTLVCGQQSRRVAVEYLKATRQITRIEFERVIIMKR